MFSKKTLAIILTSAIVFNISIPLKTYAEGTQAQTNIEEKIEDLNTDTIILNNEEPLAINEPNTITNEEEVVEEIEISKGFSRLDIYNSSLLNKEFYKDFTKVSNGYVALTKGVENKYSLVKLDSTYKIEKELEFEGLDFEINNINSNIIISYLIQDGINLSLNIEEYDNDLTLISTLTKSFTLTNANLINSDIKYVHKDNNNDYLLSVKLPSELFTGETGEDYKNKLLILNNEQTKSINGDFINIKPINDKVYFITEYGICISNGNYEELNIENIIENTTGSKTLYENKGSLFSLKNENNSYSLVKITNDSLDWNYSFGTDIVLNDIQVISEDRILLVGNKTVGNVTLPYLALLNKNGSLIYGKELSSTNDNIESFSKILIDFNDNLLLLTKMKDKQGDTSLITLNINETFLEELEADLTIELDVQNTAQISLSTNFILFDGYDGTEDIEREFDINIGSSRNYDLSVELKDHLRNIEDENKFIDKSNILIKAKDSVDYLSFEELNTPLLLLEDAVATENTKNTFNLKIKGISAEDGKYRTSFKFTIIQR